MDVNILDTIPHDVYREIAVFPQATIYHTKEWHQFLTTTFGWKVRAVCASQSGKLVFFLPFITKYRLDLKKHHICLPFCHSGIGPVYAEDFDLDTFFQDVFPLPQIEIHQSVEGAGLYQTIPNTIVFLHLHSFKNLEHVFHHFHEASIQRKIKKAQRHGVLVKQGWSAHDFALFAEMAFETSRKHGSPSYPQTFFTNLHACFQQTDALKLYVAYYENKPVAGVIFLHDQNVAIYAYGASLNNPDYFRLGVNQIVMWEAIKDAWEQQRDTVDFGTTPVSFEKLLHYKLKWGGQAYPLPYTYLHKTTGPLDRDRKSIQLASKILQTIPAYWVKRFSPSLLKWVI